MLVARVAVLAIAALILLALLVGNLVRRSNRPGWPTLTGLTVALAMTTWAACSTALLL